MKQKNPPRRRPLGRNAWLNAARQALIEEGTAGIEVNKIATRLGATRGGFYWFFENRQQLLDELLQYWASNSIALFESALRTVERDARKEYMALVRLWIDEKEYDPRWDGAVRDWARTSRTVLKTVRAVDNERIALIEGMFRDMGCTGTDAHIRARVMYYHQVGYYAMGVHESRKRRVELIPYYREVLTGGRIR